MYSRVLETVMAGVLLLTVCNVVTTPTVLCVASLAVLWAVYRRERRRAAGTIPLSDKYVLITGCDTGFGHLLAKRLHGLKCHVIAAVLNPDGPGAKHLRDMSSDRMTVLPLDVSSDNSVSDCLKVVKEMCNNTGLWGLVNNAGIATLNGAVELVTMRQYLHMANVNAFGMVRTTRAFLPLVRQAKGRIVNVTSVQGRISIPTRAAYAITKWAGETFSDITRLEMAQFGVKVIIIEPGAFGWTLEARPAVIERVRKAYEEMWSEASQEVRQFYGRQHIDLDIKNLETRAQAEEDLVPKTPVVDTMTEALTSGDPDIRYLVHAGFGCDRPCFLAHVKPFLPDRLFDRLMTYMYGEFMPVKSK